MGQPTPLLESLFKLNKSANPPPTQPHTDGHARQQNTGQLPAIRNGDETCALRPHFEDTYRNGSYTSATTAAFAARVVIAHSSGTGSSAIGKHYLCHRNNGLVVGG